MFGCATVFAVVVVQDHACRMQLTDKLLLATHIKAATVSAEVLTSKRFRIFRTAPIASPSSCAAKLR
jgi:hypothetical protein